MYPAYRDLIDSTGVENLHQVDDNDYQGDSRVLVRDYHRYGLLFFGWGSCSGCDALQAAEGNPAELATLRADLRRKIHREDSAADLLAYIEGKDWTLDVRGDDEASRAFRKRARQILLDVVAGPGCRDRWAEGDRPVTTPRPAAIDRQERS
jgi:hypothetical protein